MVSSEVVSALIGAGSSFLNTGLNIGTSAFSSGKSYKRAVSLWKMQADWQERMSNTAHQREVQDLRAAGLNPILSATGGSGAPTGSVGMPTAETFNPDVDESGLSSALAIRQQKNQNKIADSQTDLNDEIKRKTGAEWSLLQEQERNAYEEGLNIMAQRDQIKAGTAKTLAEVHRQLIENKYYAKYLQSQIESNSAGASYNRRRSSGYSYNYKLGPVQYGYTGDKQDTSLFSPYSNSAKGWHTQYEIIRGKKVPVRVRD